MNKIYRLVWSHHLNSLVAVAEHARGRGKSGSKARLITGAVASALLVIGTGQVTAADQVISVAKTAQWNIGTQLGFTAGDSLTITGSGSVVVGVSGGAGNVLLNAGSVAGAIINQGTIGHNVAGIQATVGLMINGGTLTGSVVNEGLIAGNNNTVKILNNSAIGGDITNSGGMNGGPLFVGGSSVSGDIQNSGTINAGGSGIDVNAARVGGNYVNTNRIVSGWDGMALGNGSTLTGDLRNEGSISARVGMSVWGNGNSIGGSITNDGTITASNNGISVENTRIGGDYVNTNRIVSISDGMAIGNGSTLIGNLRNEGSISGLKGMNVWGNGNSIGGSITNDGTITASNNGISVENTRIGGDYVNTNHIASGWDGMALGNGSTLTGDLRNEGNISARVGMSVWGNGNRIGGSITNDGTITASNSGIYVEKTGLAGHIINSGIIDAGGALMVNQSTVTGRVVNASTGSILGSVGIYNGSIITQGFSNSGLIESSMTGLFIFGSGTTLNGGLTNSGTILSTGIPASSVAGLGVFDSVLNGGIANSGLIQGDHGIYVGAFGGAGGTIEGGILNNAGGTISGDLTGISVDSNSVVTGDISNAGLISGGTNSLDLQNSTNPITVNNTGTLQGDVDLGNAGNILNLNGSSARVIGNVSNAVASSTVNVNGTFTSEGTFNIGYFNVNSGGLFNMNHDITATTTTVNSGGTLNVGSATRNITGDYAQTGTFRLGLTDPVGAYGKLAVSGTANVAGGVDVVINGSPNIASGTTVAGIITSTGMTVTPANLSVTDNHLFYDFTAATVSNPGFDLDLLVAVDPNPLTDAANQFNNPAALGVAGALESMFLNGIPAPMQPVFNTIGTMTPEQANAAMSQMLPLLTGGATVAMGNAMHGLNRIVQARQEGQHGRSTGDEFYGDGHLWMKPFGSWANQDDRKGVSGFDADTYGMIFGADAAVSDADRLGFALAYARSDVDSNSNVAPNSADVDTYQAVVYGSRALSPATEVHFQADVGFHKTDGERSVNLLLPGQVAKSDFDSWSFHIGAGLAHTLALSDKTSITPSVRADYARIDSESYDEKGAGALNLEVNDATVEELILSVDAKLAHRLTDRATLTANMGVGYDAINESASITSAFAGTPGTAFATRGLEPDAWSYRGGLGVAGNVTEALEVTARYDFELKEDFDNQTASVKFRWAF